MSANNVGLISALTFDIVHAPSLNTCPILLAVSKLFVYFPGESERLGERYWAVIRIPRTGHHVWDARWYQTESTGQIQVTVWTNAHIHIFLSCDISYLSQRHWNSLSPVWYIFLMCVWAQGGGAIEVSISVSYFIYLIILYEPNISVCRYCESRRSVLLDHVHEGYETEIWDHQDL